MIVSINHYFAPHTTSSTSRNILPHASSTLFSLSLSLSITHLSASSLSLSHTLLVVDMLLLVAAATKERRTARRCSLLTCQCCISRAMMMFRQGEEGKAAMNFLNTKHARVLVDGEAAKWLMVMQGLTVEHDIIATSEVLREAPLMRARWRCFRGRRPQQQHCCVAPSVQISIAT